MIRCIQNQVFWEYSLEYFVQGVFFAWTTYCELANQLVEQLSGGRLTHETQRLIERINPSQIHLTSTYYFLFAISIRQTKKRLIKITDNFLWDIPPLLTKEGTSHFLPCLMSSTQRILEQADISYLLLAINLSHRSYHDWLKRIFVPSAA